VVLDDEIEVFASESSFETDVTVMKFLVVASLVAILHRYSLLTLVNTWRPVYRDEIRNSVEIKLFFAITTTIRSDS
jgi:hypothetical protein